MLDEQQRADGVDTEGVEAVLGVDVGGGALRVEDAGEGEGEAEVGGRGGEEGRGGADGGVDGGFVWWMLVVCCMHHAQRSM